MTLKIYNSVTCNLRRLLIVAFLLVGTQRMDAFVVSENAKISLITCTPGPDLYSLFGHTAIRYQDSIRGYWVDWVYNYGTFIFDEDFYVKFARGKLDYVLSKEDFPYFQQEYIFTGRGIYEQTLILSLAEKQKMLDLLEENFLPQNRTYRYDFFYDNCSTRVRDMIIRATAKEEAMITQIDFAHQDPQQIKASSRINFSYVYPREYTFRDAIQSYLNYQPWSDFGIDLALGMPCDKKIQSGEFMFLPDSLMKEFSFAIYNDHELVSKADEILPQEYELTLDSVFTPLFVMSLFLIVHVAMGWLLRNKWRIQISDRFLLFTTGLLGVLVVFLWFFTDHTATKWNLNLLWANPFNLFLAFLPASRCRGWIQNWVKIYLFILIGIIALWWIIPQSLHIAVIPLTLGLIFTTWRMVKPQLLLGYKKSDQ